MTKVRTENAYKALIKLIYKYSHSNLADYVKENSHEDLSGNQTVKTEAKDLAQDLQDMGPTYIKLGQFLSTQADFLPKEYMIQLEQLQDNVDPLEFSEMQAVLASELDEEDYEAIMSGIITKPLAAASLAQVYRATLPTGRSVVIKIQKPGVEKQLTEDFGVFGRITAFLDNYTPLAKNIDLSKNLENFQKSIFAEINYEQELQNVNRLKANLSEYQELYVPETVERYSGRRVLALEYIAGKKLDALTDDDKRELRAPELAKTLFKAYLKQILADGFIHADPHPGNFIVTEDNRLAIIDVGMVAHFSHEIRTQLLKTIIGIANSDGAAVADAVESAGTITENYEKKEFRNLISEYVDRYSKLPISELAPGKLLLQINRSANQYGLELPYEFNILGQTLIKLDAVGKILDPEFNPKESIQENTISLIFANAKQKFNQQTLINGLISLSDTTKNFPAQLEKFIDNVAENNLKVTVKSFDEHRITDCLQKIANRITMGLIISGLIIGAALMMRVESSLNLFGYPAIAISFFLIASLFGIYFIIGIIFSDE